jgi:hypothetical protein
MVSVQLLMFAAQVAEDTPQKAAALAIGGALGGAGGVLVKAVLGAANLSYGDASVIGGAIGVFVVVLYLLL